MTDDAQRIVRELGFYKIGYCKDLPSTRRRKNGVFVHEMWAFDPQVGWLVMKIGKKFILGAKADSMMAMYNLLKKNHEKIAEEIKGKDISEI